MREESITAVGVCWGKDECLRWLVPGNIYVHQQATCINWITSLYHLSPHKLVAEPHLCFVLCVAKLLAQTDTKHVANQRLNKESWYQLRAKALHCCAHIELAWDCYSVQDLDPAPNFDSSAIHRINISILYTIGKVCLFDSTRRRILLHTLVYCGRKCHSKMAVWATYN